MRKIVFGLYGGAVGTDAWEFYEVPEDVTDEELSDYAWELAVDHAAMYGYYPRYEYEGELSEEELEDECYTEYIDGWWEPYDPDKHDGHRVGGDTSWRTF